MRNFRMNGIVWLHIALRNPCGVLGLADGWVSCWEQGPFSRAECCKPGRGACFDSIFTEAECCHRGQARLFPHARTSPPEWRLAYEWLRGAGEGHPAMAAEQRRWELEMTNASVLLSEDLQGHRVRLRVFKRAGPAVGVVLRELGEDVYRLRHISTPRLGFAVDVGASVGLVSIMLCKLMPGLRVIALEPAPANFRYLLWNLRENDVTNCVWPLNVAIGGAAATARSFYYSPTYPTWSQKADDADASDSADAWRGGWADWQIRFEVEVVTLAEVLAALGLDDVYLLKVDCEGCEWSLFASPQWGRLRHRVRHVTVELHSWALEDEAGLEAEIKRELCVHEKLGHTNERNSVCSTM